MSKQIATFHYLTQDLNNSSHEKQVQTACEAGVRWVQLRVKNKPFSEWLEIAKIVREITSSFGAVLIINDNAEIASLVNADGVHLGQENLPWTEARKILGSNRFIGLSIHSLNELAEVRNAEVDYFGLGPFRFTSTKEKIDPVLGLEGIRQIISSAHNEGILRPFIAIGGIQLCDVCPILAAGANGIAVSSIVNLSLNPHEVIHNFLQEIEIRNYQPETF